MRMLLRRVVLPCLASLLLYATLFGAVLVSLKESCTAGFWVPLAGISPVGGSPPATKFAVPSVDV